MATHPLAARSRVPCLPRRRLAIAAAVLTPLLAACGAGFQAQTNQIYQPGPGISDRSGGVYVINALIVTDGAGHGTLVAALINQQGHPDVLESVSVSTGSGKALKAAIMSGTVALPSQGAVQLADTADVRVEGTLQAGANDMIALTFHNAAPIKMLIPVVSKTSIYDGVTVGPTPPPNTPSHSNP